MATKLEQALQLVGAGFTAVQIMQLIEGTPANNPQPVHNPVENPAPANNPQPEHNPVENPAPANNPQPVHNPVENPAPVSPMEQQIWQTMQQLAATQQQLLAIQQRQQVNTANGGEPPKPVDVDGYLASIINPPINNKE